MAVTAAFTANFDGLSVSVDSSASVGAITTWDWDWGDSSTHGTSQVDSHVYDEPGDYTITLTVGDGVDTDQSIRTFLVSYTGGAVLASPRPIRLQLEEGTGNLLLESGLGNLLLEESGERLYWANLNGDNDWGRRDAYSTDQFSTICAVLTTATHWRLVLDTCPNGTATIGQVYLDSIGGYNRAPQDLTSNTSNGSYTISTNTASATAYQAFDGDLNTGVTLSPADYLQFQSSEPFSAARVGIYWASETLYASEWHVEVSNDGTNFRSIGSFSAGASEVGLSRTNVTPVDTARTITSYRYWRLVSLDATAGAPSIAAMTLRHSGTVVTPANMTDNTTPAPFVASASSDDTTNLAFQAFDGSAVTSWVSGAVTAGEYLQVDMGSAQLATELSVTQLTANKPGWVLYGSNDLTTFYAVTTVPASTPEDTHTVAWGSYYGVTPVNYQNELLSFDNPVFYLPFGTNGVTDITGNGHNLATVSGAASIAGPAAVLTGGATVRSDASATELTFADTTAVTASFTQRTYNIWVRKPTTIGRRMIYAEGDSTTGLSIYLNGSQVYAGWWSALGSQFLLATDTISNDQWNLLTTVFDNGWAYLYLNGRYQASGWVGSTTLINRPGVSILANGTSTKYHDGDSVGPGDYAGAGFYLGELAAFNVAMTPSDILMLYLVGQTNNTLSKQDDLVIASTNPGGTDAMTTQSQSIAASAVYCDEQATVSTVVDADVTLASGEGLVSKIADDTTVTANGRLIVGPSTTLQTFDETAGAWLAGDLVLFGNYELNSTGGNNVIGTGRIVVVGESATISVASMTIASVTHTIDVAIDAESVSEAKLTFGDFLGSEADTTLITIDGTAGAELQVANVDIVGNARVRMAEVADAAYDLTGTLFIADGEFQWWGVDGLQTAGTIEVDAAGTLQLGGGTTDVPEFQVDVQLHGGTVIFQEFSGTSTTQIAAGSSWTLDSSSVINVNMSVADRSTVQFFGTFVGGQPLTFNVTGDGGFAWTNPTDDPAWSDVTVVSDLSGFAATTKTVGFAYPATTEPAPAKSRSLGTGTVTLTDAAFWAGHYQAVALTIENDVLVDGYSVLDLTSSDTPATDTPIVEFSGTVTLNGEVYVYSENLASTISHLISGTVFVGQGLLGDRTLYFESGSDENLVLTGDIADLGTPVSNPLLVYQASGVGSSITFDGGGESTNFRTNLGAEAVAGEHTISRVFTDDLYNLGADVLVDVAEVGNYFQTSTTNGGGTLDMGSSALTVTGLFRLTQGTVVNLDGSDFITGAWSVDGVDMIGTATWTVVSTLVRPFMRNGTIAWSDATGSIEEGLIVAPGATDGGNNTFWALGAELDSQHTFRPGGVPSAATYDLRWVQSYSTQGGVATVSFWGDSTPRVQFNATVFTAAFTGSRAANPRLPWMPNVTGDATLAVGVSTYNLLLVDNWWILQDDSTKVGVRFCGVISETDGHSAGGAEPVVVFDRTTFENAMNAFTLSF